MNLRRVLSGKSRRGRRDRGEREEGGGGGDGDAGFGHVHGNLPNGVPEMAVQVRAGDRSGYSYQRKNRGPTNAPIDAAIRMPSEYHVRTKIADTSGQ